MPIKKAGPERLGAFSDGVIAVIITIMVLDLKAPLEATPGALFAIWPTFVSYVLSYVFVGVVWVNHHHLLRYAETAAPPVIWSNLALLFFVSLIPFSTSYMAVTRMQPFTTALYAAVFLLIAIAFQLFQFTITKQFTGDAALQAKIHAATRRNWVAMAAYLLAIPAADVRPFISLVLILAVAMLYFTPEATKRGAQ